MYVVIVEFALREGFTEQFRERVKLQAQDSLQSETSCHVFDVCIDPARTDFVLLYEVYSDRAAFEAHLHSSHFIDFDKRVRDWILGKRFFCYQRI